MNLKATLYATLTVCALGLIIVSTVLHKNTKDDVMSRALIEYRSFNQLYLRLVKSDDNLKKQLEDQYGDKYWPAIIGAKPIRSWEQALPATNDLQQTVKSMEDVKNTTPKSNSPETKAQPDN